MIQATRIAFGVLFLISDSLLAQESGTSNQLQFPDFTTRAIIAASSIAAFLVLAFLLYRKRKEVDRRAGL